MFLWKISFLQAFLEGDKKIHMSRYTIKKSRKNAGINWIQCVNFIEIFNIDLILTLDITLDITLV